VIEMEREMEMEAKIGSEVVDGNLIASSGVDK